MMDNLYTVTRQFADSWGLLGLFVTFVLVVIWAFRPGTGNTYEDISNIPFRNEEKPARVETAREASGAMFKEAWK
jgi:cytochrome c oxidase cbb3-type subunit 4